MGGQQSSTYMPDGTVAPPNFSWVQDGKIGGSGLPQSNEELMGLVRLNVALLITLTEVPIGPGLNNTGVEFPDDIFVNNVLDHLRIIHVPTVDGTPPTVEQTHQIILEADKCIAAGKAVIAHCYAGEGRTGTIIACYLVRAGMAPGDAINYVRAKRERSIHNHSQERAVVLYDEYLKKLTNSMLVGPRYAAPSMGTYSPTYSNYSPTLRSTSPTTMHRVLSRSNSPHNHSPHVPQTRPFNQSMAGTSSLHLGNSSIPIQLSPRGTGSPGHSLGSYSVSPQYSSASMVPGSASPQALSTRGTLTRNRSTSPHYQY